MKNSIKRTAIAVATSVTLVVGVGFGTASADDHLANGATSEGVDNRGFGNPVGANPSGTSRPAAQPGTVPGLGNPNAGADQGTPSFECDVLHVRLAARSSGNGPACD